MKCPHCGEEIRFQESSPGAVVKLENKIKQSLDDIKKKITMTITK